MDWTAPAIVLATRPYGEGDALATLLTEAHGAHRGLAKGGASRARAGTWQQGNLVEARWTARLADQLGTLTAELVHPTAALAMPDPLSLAILDSACAIAEGALPEREPHGRVFSGLLRLLATLDGAASLAELVRWEATLLAELGYGLDLAACAVTGRTDHLTHVSPRTGRAVSADAAGPWRDRLLRLPAFLAPAASPDVPATPSPEFPPTDAPDTSAVPHDRAAPHGRAAPHDRAAPHERAAHGNPGSLAPNAPTDAPPFTGNRAPTLEDCRDGLRLTAHFLARDAFGHTNKPLPPARLRLTDRVATLAGATPPPA